MASNYSYNATYNHSNASQIHQPTPYGSGDPYYNESTGFITPPAGAKKGRSKWVTIGIPVAVLVIIGAVVGIVFAVRGNSSDSKGGSSSSSENGDQSTGGGGNGVNNNIGLFPTATDSQYLLPLYPSAVCPPLVMCSCASQFTRFPLDGLCPVPQSHVQRFEQRGIVARRPLRSHFSLRYRCP